jgi:hypothetical protein
MLDEKKPYHSWDKLHSRLVLPIRKPFDKPRHRMTGYPRRRCMRSNDHGICLLCNIHQAEWSFFGSVGSGACWVGEVATEIVEIKKRTIF